MRDSNLNRLEPDCHSPTIGRLAIVTFLFLVTVVASAIQRSDAQGLYVPVKVSNVSSQTSASGSLVTIAADKALSKAQTWQDEEGFHVVFPNTISADSLKPGRGVKVRRIGTSLEVVAQTRPGTRVSVSHAHNHLNLIIEGKLESKPGESASRQPSLSPEERQLFQEQANNQTYRAPDKPLPIPERAVSSIPEVQNSASPVAGAQHQTNEPVVNSPNEILAKAGDPVAPKVTVDPEEESVLSSVFSGTGLLVVLALGMFGFLVSRKVRSKQPAVSTTSAASRDKEEPSTVGEPVNSSQGSAPNNALVRMGETAPTAKTQKHAVQRNTVAGPTSLYGAYRIDQEVGKLILGQAHRLDVLSSRAVDDRRAIETSLIKGLHSNELDESSQRRAREALEEYGFVARQCAALLLAPDAFERTSAARILGEIKSPAALPFLLESLYDSESIVRNEAVLSIGELKIPSAIGALLDIARTHPDVPSALLSRTLSACSVEGLDFFDAVVSDSSLLGSGDVGAVVMEIDHLEPSAPIESLPAESDDEMLTQSLAALASESVEDRAEALKILVQFRVQSAVDAIAHVARQDPAPTIRSLAISSLGTINHESVFATVVIGMADESREVRAAAARSINRLSFDRADAYVHALEMCDEATLQAVAKACIQAGIVSQNLDRLTYADHRQAYETFSLICLLTRAGMNEPVLAAIADHPRTDVRLKVIHFLGSTGDTRVVDQLRELAVRDGMTESVKTALLEAIYKLDKDNVDDSVVAAELPADDNVFGEILETFETEETVDSDLEVLTANTGTFEVDAPTEADHYEV